MNALSGAALIVFTHDAEMVYGISPGGFAVAPSCSAASTPRQAETLPPCRHPLRQARRQLPRYGPTRFNAGVDAR
jgi:hypothetical protein